MFLTDIDEHGTMLRTVSFGGGERTVLGLNGWSAAWEPSRMRCAWRCSVTSRESTVTRRTTPSGPDTGAM